MSMMPRRRDDEVSVWRDGRDAGVGFVDLGVMPGLIKSA
jgi:hypothetical protein